MNNLYRANINKIENRGENPPPKKTKFDFNTIKNNTCNSLNDVENFLGDLRNFWKYVKLYKLLK